MAAVMRVASVAPVRAAKLSKASRTRTATLAAPKGLRGASLKVRAAADVDQETGIKKMRDGIKEAASENLLTPRFYTTDFDEMEQLFSKEINPNLDEDELVAILQEFREDFNQKHFVRNDSFKAAADGITGDARRIFIEFLERSCTAEFSGFLLYKELGRRLKKTAPVAAEIFTLMSRDEARHAGFLNKAMSDFNLALDLGFLTKNRQVRSHLSRPPSRFRATANVPRRSDNFPLPFSSFDETQPPAETRRCRLSFSRCDLGQTRSSLR